MCSSDLPLSASESMGALGLFHTRGELGSGSGGSEIQEGLAKGMTLDQIAAAMAAKRGNTYDEAGKAVARSNAENGASIDEQNARGAAGAEMRAWRIFQDKRSRESKFQAVKDFFVPDVIEKGYYDMHDALNSSLGTMTPIKGSVDGGYMQAVDKTEEEINLGREIRGMSNAFKQIQTRPNGNTEAKN